jgi:hypothetical protein
MSGGVAIGYSLHQLLDDAFGDEPAKQHGSERFFGQSGISVIRRFRLQFSGGFMEEARSRDPGSVSAFCTAHFR